MRLTSKGRASALTRSVRVGSVAVLGVSASLIWWAAPAANAVQASQSTLVSAVPAADTPDINDGAVFAIAQVGSQIILGGTFSSVSPAADQSTDYSLPYTFSFNAVTGAIDTTGFLPALNGKVDAVIPGPKHDEVYLAGQFTSVDGVAMRVALLDTATGAVVSSWQPSSINNTVAKLVLADGRLFVAGNFTTVGGHSHRGLVALDPTTGKVTSYVDLSFTGHHNYGTHCDPAKQTCAPGTVGLKSMDINPAGSRLIAIGDFTSVSSLPRDQIAMIDLGKSKATVDTHWSTLAYSAACFDNSFDSYIRDVQFSPTGSYFVVAATGGIGTNSDGTNSSCDSAARFDSDATGADVRPVWIDYSGEDSLWSVAITGSAVYVGGHQRWLNNSLGHNVAAAGAVARPGIAALSPVNGLPFTWNPGRNPRGQGCYALLATSTGLWIGSDTDYIGNRTYLRRKVAFFPLAGGETPPQETTPRLPGRVYQVGATAVDAAHPNRMSFREFNGMTTGTAIPLSTGIPWGSVRGAFTVNGEVIYGETDGNLYERSFDGTTFGPQVELDPYDDPTWDNVQTGSGQTYQGLPSTFLSEIPSVSSMFFSAGRLFYTIAGAHDLHWRWFEPESGVVGSDEFTVSSRIGFGHVAGAFLARGRLYYAPQTSGELRSVRWSGDGPTGTSTLVDRSTGWASRGLFLLAGATDPTPTPTAAFTAHCGARPTCRFTASPWIDPDGGVVRYSWKFGDGATRRMSTSNTASHRYRANGRYHVSLTVTDTAGATASAGGRAVVRAPLQKVDFEAAAKATGDAAKVRVRLPAAASAGEAMMLFASSASGSARITSPAGWNVIGHASHRGLTTAVFDRVVPRRQIPKSVTVQFSKAAHSTLVLAVYRHAELPIERSAVRDGAATKTHAAPAVHGLAPESLVVGYWTQLADRATTWTAPPGLRARVVAAGHTRPVDSALLADTVVPARGAYRPGTARTSVAGRSAVEWVVALAPALG